MGWLRRVFEYIALRLESLLGPVIYGMTRLLAPSGLPQKTFEQLYRHPDPWHYATSTYEQAKQNRALELVGNENPSRVLEIGCAEGVFSEKLAAHGIGSQIVGIDISTRAIARARERCARFGHVEFRSANILTESPGGMFDLIFIMEILYYMGRDLRAVCTRLAPALGDGCKVFLMHPAGEAHLHRSFQDLLGLTLVSEQLVKDNPRPYLVTILQRTSRAASP
jgi:2-polyprenyl-3-methyl-5-hydroxy-6-metoxy-1,4-benzoquinol methylase